MDKTALLVNEWLQQNLVIRYPSPQGPVLLIQASWKALYSTLLGGLPGSGKSTLARLILAQSALQRSRFIVIDPHLGAGEDSLGESLAPPAQPHTLQRR